jgi:serine/threonine protein phosphatase PrpC
MKRLKRSPSRSRRPVSRGRRPTPRSRPSPPPARKPAAAKAAATRSASAPPLRAEGLTDCGRREHNEDAFYCHCDGASGLFIVADGMGGKAAGETASRAVVTVLPLLLDQQLAALAGPTPQQVAATLGESLRQLSQDLFQQSQSVPALAGLGSTAAVLLFRGGIAYIAHAGDSRVYLLRRGTLTCLTEDHTTAMALVQAGHLSSEAARDHPLSNSLEEYIGKELALNPGTRHRQIRPGDRWLLCTDGLLRGLEEAVLRSLLRRSVGPDETCRNLIAAAAAADGSDNITAVIVDVEKA